MSKRRNLEADVVEFFLLAPYEKAATVFAIVRGMMKRREAIDVERRPAPRAKRAKSNGGELAASHAQE